MKKEINKKLKLDSIDWAEVLDALDEKTTGFKESDIKYALKKTGRNFNNNGPFHSTVREFIKKLGDTVEIQLVGGEKVYKVKSLKDAYIRAGRKQRNIVKSKPVVISVPIVKEEKKPEETEENKIKDLFKRSYSHLQNTLCVLAVFIKHGKNKISGHDFRNDYEILLGNNWNTLMSSGKPMIMEILRRLEYGSLEITKKNTIDSFWELKLSVEILDAYIKLQEIYKKLSGEEPKNLDDYISSVTTPKEEPKEDKFKILKKELETTPVLREESSIIKWEKWLLLEALRSYECKPTKISHLVDWIKTNRHEDISENQALRHLRDLQSDYEGSITFQPGDRVSLDYEAGKSICKLYDPKKLEETIYVKLRLTPEDVQNFQDLVFKVDEAIGEGKYLYEIKVNRSYGSELCLKDLMKFIRITSGKIYSNNSFMIERVKKILEYEEEKDKTKKVNLKILERF